MNGEKKIILFGAGEFGKKALEYFGNDKVAFYVDNNAKLSGTIVNGKKVIAFTELLEQYRDYQIVIAVDIRKTAVIANQLEQHGITEYISYMELVNHFKKPNGESKNIDWISRMNLVGKWIEENTIQGGGIINNTDVRQSYPEVTGYFIPTLLRWGFREKAVNYAKWLCNIQKEDGSWYDTYDLHPYIFDSAQILKGLLAVREILPQADEHIRRGCDWILSQMDSEGRLPKPVYADWGAEGICSELIHMYCISPIMEAGSIFCNAEYKIAAKKISQYYITNYKEQILDFGFLSHFYAYVMEALVDIGERTLAQEAMDKMIEVQKEDGSIPAYKNVNWVCSTGILQLATVWYKLGDIIHGDKALGYAVKLQNESGGWFGSYAVSDAPKATDYKGWPDYFPESEISWAVKYFLDAVYYKCRAEFEEQADTFMDEISVTDGRYRFILQEIKDANPQTVCDIGCGKGRYIKNLIKDVNGIRFCAVDISERVMESIPESVEKKAGILTNIPYENEYFDMVYVVEALEHSILAENAVRELIRVIKKNGKAVIIDKSKAAMGMLEIDEWEQWFPDEFFEKIAEENGCTLATVHNISYEDYADGLFNGWILQKL